jgi:hypothetical protein
MYNKRAVVDHWRPMTIDVWKARAPMLAATEWQFCSMHPEVPPWYWRIFNQAAQRPPSGSKAQRLARFVPPWLPWLGTLVWERAGTQWAQEIAPYFLAAWERAAAGEASVQPDVEALLAERSSSPGGS